MIDETVVNGGRWAVGQPLTWLHSLHPRGNPDFEGDPIQAPMQSSCEDIRFAIKFTLDTFKELTA